MGAAMKRLPWIFVGVLAVLCLWGWLRPTYRIPGRTVRDTVTVTDTVRDTVPRPLLVRFDHWDTVPVPIPVQGAADTVRDTVYVPLPIEQREYLTEDYHAVISGYRPRLELMEVFRRTRTVTMTERPKRWGLGVQAGVGYPQGWYVGVGVSYDLWQW